MMSRCRHSVGDQVAVSTTVDAIGCSYAENFLVTLNNKEKEQFKSRVSCLVFFLSFNKLVTVKE